MNPCEVRCLSLSIVEYVSPVSRDTSQIVTGARRGHDRGTTGARQEILGQRRSGSPRSIDLHPLHSTIKKSYRLNFVFTRSSDLHLHFFSECGHAVATRTGTRPSFGRRKPTFHSLFPFGRMSTNEGKKLSYQRTEDEMFFSRDHRCRRDLSRSLPSH